MPVKKTRMPPNFFLLFTLAVAVGLCGMPLVAQADPGLTVAAAPTGGLAAQVEVTGSTGDNDQAVDTAEKLIHPAYVNGYEDGTFRPERTISRAELAAMLDRLQSGGAARVSGTFAAFPDVSTASWASEAIGRIQIAGLMTGSPDGSFRPGFAVTRAELAVIGGRLKLAPADSTAAAAAQPTDTAGHWAEAAIAAAVQAGWLSVESDGAFRPSRPLTRAEAVFALNRLFDRSPMNGAQLSYTDVPVDHWAYADIAEATLSHDAVRRSDGSESIVR